MGRNEEITESREGGKRRKRKRPLILRIIGFFFHLFLICLVLGIAALAAVYFRTKPLQDQAQKQMYEILSQMNDGTFKRETNTLVYDSEEKLLSKLGYENYKYVTIDKVSRYVQDGYIDVEDKHFLTHHGVDYLRTFKAGALYLRGKITGDDSITQGGSTITQQIVKNNLLSQEQTVERKFLEILLARQIEKEFSKSQIMEFYVNSCYYGNGCYGIEGASKYYFGVSAKDLTIAQAAILVGTSNSPNNFNPVADYELSMSKKRMVLGEMLEEGDIAQEEYESADAEQPKIVQKTEKSDPDNYMVSYAVHEAALKLMEYENFPFRYTFESEEEYQEYSKEYGKAYSAADSQLRSGGFEIYTSFDTSVQKKLQKSVDSTLSGEKDKQANGQYSLQAAAAVVDNETGMVIAAVGGRGTKSSYNRAFQAARQPGSTIKPLLDYGPAIERGIVTPGSMMQDKQITIAGYSPKNYNGSFRGNTSIREALGRSINTIAVQVFDETGSQTALSFLGDLRFSTLTFGDSFNTAIALGGFTKGVTVEDMLRGYATIENGGVMRDNTCIVSIARETGEKIYTHNSEGIKAVYSEDTAFMLTDMMIGVFAEDYGSAHTAYTEDQIYAGKTGTTDSNKDAWFAGFSKYYTTVTWVGCDTPQAVEGLIGGGYPLTIWSSFMQKMHAARVRTEFLPPESVKLANSSGKQKSIDYTESIYESRPSGWDYISTTLTETVADNEALRQDRENYKVAQQAVENFEDYQITDVESAKEFVDVYNYVMGLVNQVGNEADHEELQERAEYKYSLLSGDVAANWEERIAEREKQRAEEKRVSNAQKAQDSAAKALKEIKKIRIDVVKSYIEYFKNVKVYTDDVEEMAEYADAALDRCKSYSDYENLDSKLTKAKQKAYNKKTLAELEEEKEEAAEEKRRAQEERRRAREAEEEAQRELEEFEKELERELEEEEE